MPRKDEAKKLRVAEAYRYLNGLKKDEDFQKYFWGHVELQAKRCQDDLRDTSASEAQLRWAQGGLDFFDTLERIFAVTEISHKALNQDTRGTRDERRTKRRE